MPRLIVDKHSCVHNHAWWRMRNGVICRGPGKFETFFKYDPAVQPGSYVWERCRANRRLPWREVM